MLLFSNAIKDKTVKKWHMSLSDISARKPEILETCLVIYQMKEWDGVHHMNWKLLLKYDN